MPTFLLVRHGETDYNKKMRIAGRMHGVHLNKKGQKDAQALAHALARLPIKAIYASPLERTMETAGPLATALKQEIIPMPGLLETDCGDWQGKSVKMLRRQKVWKSLQHHPSLFRFPGGGESVAECQHRMVETLESIRYKHGAEDLVVCVSHSDPLKQLIVYYLGMPLDHFQQLTINTASITVLQVNDNGVRLLTLNYSLDFSWEMFRPPVQKEIPIPHSVLPTA